MRMTSPSGLFIEELDGNPSGLFSKLKVPNGSLTDNSDGSSTLNIVAGALGTASSDTQVLFNDGGIIVGDFGLTYIKSLDTLNSGKFQGSGVVAFQTPGLEWFVTGNGLMSYLGGSYLVAAGFQPFAFQYAADLSVGLLFDEGAGAFTLTASGPVAILQSFPANGNFRISGNFDKISLGALDIGPTNATSIVYGNSSTTSHTFIVNGTGDGKIVLPNDSIGPAELDDTGSYTITGLAVKAGTSSGFTVMVGGCTFSHFADVNNSGTSETDLYSDTILANTFARNGDKIRGHYQVLLTGAAASTQQVKIKFGPSGSETTIYDSGALSIGVATNNMTLNVVIIRESSTVVRCAVFVATDFATLFPYSSYTRITGLTLSNAQVLKITGTAAGAGGISNQITAKESFIEWISS